MDQRIDLLVGSAFPVPCNLQLPVATSSNIILQYPVDTHLLVDEEVYMPNHEPRDGTCWLTTTELARAFNVSRWTVYRARKAGRLRFCEPLPGTYRILQGRWRARPQPPKRAAQTANLRKYASSSLHRGDLATSCIVTDEQHMQKMNTYHTLRINT